MLDSYAVSDKKLVSQIAKKVEKNFKSQTMFLSKLVKTKSVNGFTPENSVLTEPVEKKASDLVYKKLKKLGMKPKRVGASKTRSNVVASIGPRRYRKSLILNGHMDTRVGDENGKADPFSGTVRYGRLYGVGVLDMKASLSAYVYAVKALMDLGVDLDGRLTLAFVVDSEPGSCSEWGTSYLLTKGVKARAAVIAKPCSHTVAIGHRGGYRFKITTHGEAVHTGLSLWERKKKGRNAVVDMARVITALEKTEIAHKTARLFPGRKPVFTFPTKIEGGGAVNMVPSKCVAYGDVRLMPGNSDKQVKLLIEEKLSHLKGVVWEIEDLLFVPAVEIDPKDDLVQVLVGEATDVLGQEPEVRGVGPWNDAWMYVNRDIPTICGFGPDGEGVGTNNEWVSLKSLKQVTEIYARFIVKYLGLKKVE